MTIHWKAVEKYFTVMLFVFQFCLDLALSGLRSFLTLTICFLVPKLGEMEERISLGKMISFYE